MKELIKRLETMLDRLDYELDQEDRDTLNEAIGALKAIDIVSAIKRIKTKEVIK